MSIETEFRAALLAHGPLVALIGQGVALNAAPDAQTLPYVVYAVAHDYTYTLDGSLADDTASITAQCWAKTAAQAEQVADAVATAIGAAPVTAYAAVLLRETVFDPETSLDGVAITATWSAASA